jgi:hypothetical protein
MRKTLIILAMLAACSDRQKSFVSESDPFTLQFTNKAGKNYKLPIYVRGGEVFVVGTLEKRDKLHFYEADGGQYPLRKGDFVVTQNLSDVSNITAVSAIETATNAVVFNNPSQGNFEARFDQTLKGKVLIAGTDHQFEVSPNKDLLRIDQNADGKYNAAQALIITQNGIAITQTALNDANFLQTLR